MKKNEEAFLRAIEISKEKFSDSCGSWLGRVNRMLSAMPHHSQKFNDMNLKVSNNPCVNTPGRSHNLTFCVCLLCRNHM